jgi:hypothetical protein
MKIYKFSTDSESGTVQAESLQAAYDSLLATITVEMIEDGATLWVEDTITRDRITLS